MSLAFVLGNGISRAPVDLSACRRLGTVVGCNAIYREFTPDILISTDAGISQEIQISGYAKSYLHYTRRPMDGYGSKKIDKRWFGYSSGPIAAAYAALEHSRIYLLGFDMGGTLEGKFNNVYADTDHYKRSTDAPTYSGNWTRQLALICKEFAHCHFVRVRGATTADIGTLNSITNLVHMDISEFLDRLNNLKDL